MKIDPELFPFYSSAEILQFFTNKTLEIYFQSKVIVKVKSNFRRAIYWGDKTKMEVWFEINGESYTEWKEVEQVAKLKAFL